MAHQLQKDLVNDIGSNFFSLIADEYTDINNYEQLTVCLQWIDDTLEEHEDFLGIYLIPDIASDTVVSVIKDAFIRLQLSLQNCWGQCYNGACNMLGKSSGVKIWESVPPELKSLPYMLFKKQYKALNTDHSLTASCIRYAGHHFFPVILICTYVLITLNMRPTPN